MIYNGYYVTYAYTGLVYGIAAFASIILGIVLFFTFFGKKNEGKLTGWKRKLYNFMNFNRFYAEDILRFFYIVSVCLCTALGAAAIVMGSFFAGICELVILNVILRVGYELLMMFIILCRKTVSADRRLAKIEDALAAKEAKEVAKEAEYAEEAKQAESREVSESPNTPDCY